MSDLPSRKYENLDALIARMGLTRPPRPDAATLDVAFLEGDAKPTLSIRGLSTLAYAAGFTQWHYRSPHPIGATMDGSYWAGGMVGGMYGLNDGDTITVSAPDGVAVLAVFLDGCSNGRVTFGVLSLSSRASAV